MQELNRIKANLPQQCELIGDWAGRVFLVNISIVRLGFCMNNFLVLLTLRVRLTGLHS